MDATTQEGQTMADEKNKGDREALERAVYLMEQLNRTTYTYAADTFEIIGELIMLVRHNWIKDRVLRSTDENKN